MADAVKTLVGAATATMIAMLAGFALAIAFGILDLFVAASLTAEGYGPSIGRVAAYALEWGLFALWMTIFVWAVRHGMLTVAGALLGQPESRRVATGAAIGVVWHSCQRLS